MTQEDRKRARSSKKAARRKARRQVREVLDRATPVLGVP